jgi:hypothetical protein
MLMTYNKFDLPFEAIRRTGSYRIIKETGINNEVHYEVAFEMMGVDKGVFWQTAFEQRYEPTGHPYNVTMRFETEDQALMYVNRGMRTREIVKEGRISND